MTVGTIRALAELLDDHAPYAEPMSWDPTWPVAPWTWADARTARRLDYVDPFRQSAPVWPE